VPIEGQKTESQEMGKTDAAQQTALSDSVGRNRENVIYSHRMKSTIDSIPKEMQNDLFGTLNQGTVKSAVLNFISKGINTPFGSLSAPAFTDVAIQTTPAVVRNQRADGSNPLLEKRQLVLSDLGRLTLAFTAVANKGQGAISDKERVMYAEAIADPNRSTAGIIKLMALSVELATSHAEQTQGAWENAKNAGLSWREFKGSAEYKRMVADQIKESQAALIPYRRAR
jgi:hypothetical protein